MTRKAPARLFLPTALCLALIGCAGSPASMPRDEVGSGEVAPSGDAEVTRTARISGEGVPLAVPSRDQLLKNTIDSASLAAMEIGSPDAIKLAVERINADPHGMTDQNRAMLAVGAELMRILYPLEPVTWAMPSVPESSPYIGAIKSARMGVYDFNTGNADFLSIVLPSLVLAVSETPGEYYADAEDALQKAASRNPKSVLPPYFMALLTRRQGKKDASGAWYEKAWKLDSSCYPAGVGYARYLLDRGNGPASYAVALALAAKYPDAAEMAALCAQSAFSSRDWDSADPWILRVLKNDPGNAPFLLMRARILVERKEYLKASSLLDAFATKNRTDRDYLILKSRVLREWNRNLVEVTAILKEAQQLYPDDVEVMLATAEVCYQTGQTVNGLSGRDLVRAVLRRDGANAAALTLLAADQIASGEWADAVRTAEALVKVTPTDGSRVLLAKACLGAGQKARAVSLSRDLFQKQGTDELVASLYLKALIETGDVKTASEIISSRLAAASPSLKSVLYYYQGLLADDGDARLAALRSSLLSDPRNILSLFAMYEWYFARQDYRKAQYYLKQVIALDSTNASYARLQSKLDELLAP